jgi:hypothetical protein
MTKGILLLGFSVLIGSFVLFGQNLNDRLEVASLSSKNDKSIYHQCFEEICKKPVEDFVQNYPDYSGLISDELEAELQNFITQYSTNETEIQRLVKIKVGEILSGELSGEVDFGLFDIRKIYFYQRDIIKSHRDLGSFKDYMKTAFSNPNLQVFEQGSDSQKWADEGFLFDEIIAVQKLSGRSDLEKYSLELFPNTPNYKDRLRQLSFKMVEKNEALNWGLGLDLKGQGWSGEMFLEKGLFNEEYFMDDLRGLYYTNMLLKAVDKTTTLEKIKESFQNFANEPSYGLIHDEAWIYDAFVNLEMMCKETIQDELYWASSDLRNRSIKKHFVKLKDVAKTMFSFDDKQKKSDFDKKIDALELIKSRSIQEARVFYPYYFKKLVSSQKNSIELLRGNNFKDVVLYLHSYLSLLPEFNREGETPEEREMEDYDFIKKLSLHNEACRPFDDIQSYKGSFFSPDDNYLFLEMKSLRRFKDGVMTLAHELGHGISFTFKEDYVHGFKTSVKSDVWNKRSCINNYYPKDPKSEESERLQTEEDWADFFAVKLVSKYKTTGDHSWASEKFECEFVTPDDLNAETRDPMKPYRWGDFEDSHSSNLFRMIAQDYYSKGSLGPKCTELANKETKILDKCE